MTGCKNLRIVNIKSRSPDIRIFVDGIMESKNLIHLEEVFWKDVLVMFFSERMLRVQVSFRW